MKKNLLAALLFLSLFSTAQTGIWGVAGAGAQYNAGAIFKMDGSGNNYAVKESFFRFDGDYPQASLMQASDGKLYGITSSCCTFDAFSVFFRYDPSTKVYERLVNFDESINGLNSNASPIQAKNGKIYGVATKGGVFNQGVIFEFEPGTKVYKKVYDFDTINGSNPQSALLEASDGMLYGLTNRGGNKDYGVLFQFDAQTGTYKKKVDMSGPPVNGGNPLGSLIQAKNGKLYGLTSAGGKDDFGTLFEFDPVTADFATKIEFDSHTTGGTPFGSLLEASDGNLYGVTDGGGTGGFGVLFQYNPNTAAFNVKINFDEATNGSNPHSSLIQASDGKLYGNTQYGGTAGDGTLFQYDIATGILTKKFQFDDAGEGTGRYPIAALLQAKDGILYGLAYNGGFDNSGAMYTYNIATSAFKKIFDFHEGPNGSQPVGGLTQANDKMMYGVTIAGGANRNGTIYQYDPAFQTYEKKFDFDKMVSGDAPQSLLLLANDGKLYGTATYGGSKDNGVLFRFDPVTSNLEIKAEFDSLNGSNPSGELIQLSDGKIYGLARKGGAKDDGVLFQYDPATSKCINKIDFENKSKGAYPEGGLTLGADGKLYGVTTEGGSNFSNDVANGYGSLFQYDPSTNVFEKKADFDSLLGYNPNGTLVKAADGKLYGITRNGGANIKEVPSGDGTIFQYDPATSTLIKKMDFDRFVTGGSSNGSLLLASDGNLYGATNEGGKYDKGVIFQFDPKTFNFTNKKDLNQLSGKLPQRAKLMEFDITKSIPVNESQLSMDAYPNPGREQVVIQFGETVTAATLKLVTLTGQTVVEKTHVSGDHFFLNVSGISSGAYFIEIVEKDQVSRLKFIRE